MNYYDHIEDYCEGHLDDSANADFEKAMQQDASLAGAVAQYASGKKIAEGLLEMDIMETIDGLRSVEGAEDTSEEGLIPRQKVGSKYVSWIKWIIVLLTIVGLAYLFSRLKPTIEIDNNKSFASLYEEPFWPIVRSNSDNIIAQASEKYLNGDLQSAKALLLGSSDDPILHRYWLAEMYLKKGEIDSSQLYLPKADEIVIQKDRINYIHAIIAIKKGDYQLAKKYKEQLPKEDFKKLYSFLENI